MPDEITVEITIDQDVIERTPEVPVNDGELLREIEESIEPSGEWELFRAGAFPPASLPPGVPEPPAPRAAASSKRGRSS